MKEPVSRAIISRSSFRKNMSMYLHDSVDCKMIEIAMPKKIGNRVVIDKAYFDGLLDQLRTAQRTIKIIHNPRTMARLTRTRL